MTTETNQVRIVLDTFFSSLSSIEYYSVQVRTKFLFFYYWKKISIFDKDVFYWRRVFPYYEAKMLAIIFKKKDSFKEFMEESKRLYNEYQESLKEREEKSRERLKQKEKVEYF